MFVSAIICTHNPDPRILEETLGHLGVQDLPREQWDLTVIDNLSDPPVGELRAGKRSVRVVREDQLGLTAARLRGLRETTGEIVVYIDDDNFLDPAYLRAAMEIMARNPRVGVLGGRCLPRVEGDPPDYLEEVLPILACRDFGDAYIDAGWESCPEPRVYPACAPVGAGMVVRREVMEQYVAAIKDDRARRGLDRAGSSLSSGGDNDLVLTALENGWRVAYSPELRLEHFLPRRRLERSYLARLARESHRTWVQVKQLHRMNALKRVPGFLLPLYRCRYFFSARAWKSEVAYIRWQSLCGQAEGRALTRR